MKRIALVVSLLFILSLACSFGQTSEPAPTSPLVSEKRCGDGVCDGPENFQLCPQDCPLSGEAAPQGGNGDQSSPSDQPVVETEAEAEALADSVADRAVLSGIVNTTVTLDRQMGSGDCGVDPWRPENCSMPPVHWWGLHLEASAHTPVLIIPDGENRWVVTNMPETVSQYGYDAASFNRTNGKYDVASIDPSINPECNASISGQDFGLQVMGTVQSGQIELILSTEPHELINGNCMQAGFSWDTTTLLHGWAAVMSGDPYDLTGVLLFANRTGEAGVYSNTFMGEVNPSPEKRDKVTATLEFWCVEQSSAQVQSPISCPWE